MITKSLQDKKNGFTVVELIVIIVVIGILASISIVGYSGLQGRSRDAERKADIESIQSVLETYRDQTGKYPSQADAITNGVTFFTANRLAEAALVTPTAADGVTSSLQWTATPTIDTYGYQSFKVDNSACLLSTDTCTKYSLRYRAENGGALTTILSKYGQS